MDRARCFRRKMEKNRSTKGNNETDVVTERGENKWRERQK